MRYEKNGMIYELRDGNDRFSKVAVFLGRKEDVSPPLEPKKKKATKKKVTKKRVSKKKASRKKVSTTSSK